MKRLLVTPLVAVAFCFCPECGTAQSDTTGYRDTIRTYRLGQVLVAGARPSELQSARSIPLSRIAATDAISVSGLGRLIPAARVQTNSRGEVLMYLRGSGERQLALFFDGALLNIPWDNRVDLSLIPTNAIGGITVTRGIPSVLWGINVLGGAVNVSSQELSSPGFLTEINLAAGENGLYTANAAHLGSMGPFNYIAALGTSGRDGIPLPDFDLLKNAPGDPITFHQADDQLRTNTASHIRNGFARGEYRFSDNSAIGLSVNAIDSKKGVAPESHVEDARFWRYSDWNNLTVTLNGEAAFDDAGQWGLRGSAWWSGFRQMIDQYENAEYARPTDRQEDDDATIGGRVIAEHKVGDTRVSLGLNILQSRHDQRDLTLDSSGIVINGETTPTLTYRQAAISAGLEGEVDVADGIRASAGFGYDHLTTPKTGDKPARDGLGDIQFTGGLAWDASQLLTISANGGRKTRFPTLRELFGEALRRFLVNPDLKPESSILLDLGADVHGAGWLASIAIFSRITADAIDQKNVATQSGTKRQRINLPGTRAYGVEVVGSLRANNDLRFDGHLTAIHARGVATAGDGTDSTFQLAERPEYLGTVGGSWNALSDLNVAADLELTGSAVGLSPDNEFIALEPASILNARVSYRFALPSLSHNGLIEVWARVRNILNGVEMPQLGLPSAGREVSGGVKIVM